MNKMKALICHGPNQLELTTLARPACRQGYVRVRIGHIGICGTDYHIYRGQQPYLTYPRVMGHELSGCAVDGSSDGRIEPGDLVVVNPYLSCGNCHACQLGKPNCCENIAVLGVHTDGGMTEEILVPEGNLYSADGLSDKAAAMVEFLAIGAHGIRRSHLQSESDVLIVGAGPIGIGAAIFAKIAGANVTLRDSSATRLELARTVCPDAVLEQTGQEKPGAYDTMFDATGNIKAMNAGIDWLAHGGTYVLLSIVKDDLCFADPEFHKREATLVASRNALAADFDHVIENIRNGSVPIDALATHECSFEEAVAKLPLWASDRDSLIKAVISV